MEQDCRLCVSLGITTLTPSSVVRRCVDRNCGGKVFYANPRQLCQYYFNFLELCLEEDYYLEMLYREKSLHKSSEFKKAWRVFTIDIIAGKSRESIDILATYYGLRKRRSIADALQKIDCSEPDNVCSVCTINHEDGGSFLFCPRCGNMVCGYCRKRLRTRGCPQCRFDSKGNINLKLRGLYNIISSRRGDVVQYAILSLSNLYLKMGNILDSERLAKKLIEDGFWKALIIMARIHFLRHEDKTGIELLELGAVKRDLACIKELGYMYMKKKKKSKAKHYYLLALELGDEDVLHLIW